MTCTLVRESRGRQHWYSLPCCTACRRAGQKWSGTARPGVAGPSRWGTLSEAGRILRLHPKTVLNLIESGELKVRPNTENTKRLHVDLDLARKLQRSEHSDVPWRKAAKNDWRFNCAFRRAARRWRFTRCTSSYVAWAIGIGRHRFIFATTRNNVQG